jgi:hypothetical protein
MKKLLLILLVTSPFITMASRHVCGYITLKSMGGYTYQATIMDYVVGDPENSFACDSTYSAADTIEIFWGDGIGELITPSNGSGDSVCDCRKVEIFTGTHTYPGPGTYQCLYKGSPRIGGIVNMTNSINQQMVIFNTLVIPRTTIDSLPSPSITNPPICTYGCLANCYTYNPGVVFPKGDSISYSLGNCSGATGYYIPAHVSINPVSGQLSWCNPDTLGLFNFSIIMTTYVPTTVLSKKIQLAVDTEEMELEVEIQSVCPAGIKELKVSNSVTVFPDPSDGKFTVQVANSNNIAHSYVDIYNMLGQKVYTAPLNSWVDGMSLIQVSLNTCNGVYLYRVITESGDLISAGKFILQK